MAVKQPSKNLHKHAMPILMVTVAFLVLTSAMATRSNTSGRHPQNVIARALVTRVFSVKLSGGLADIILNNRTSASQARSTGSVLNGINQAGRFTQLSLDFQSPSSL